MAFELSFHAFIANLASKGICLLIMFLVVFVKFVEKGFFGGPGIGAGGTVGIKFALEFCGLLFPASLDPIGFGCSAIVHLLLRNRLLRPKFRKPTQEMSPQIIQPLLLQIDSS